jgi:hypothetical protein
MAFRGDGLNDIFDENLTVRKKLSTDSFEMPTGAGNTKVLTSDANGIGTWQAAGAGAETDPLSLHLAGTAGGQTAYGGTNATDDLILINTSAGTSPQCIYIRDDEIRLYAASGEINLYANGGMLSLYSNTGAIVPAFDAGDVYPQDLGETATPLRWRDIHMNGTITGANNTCPMGSITMYGAETPPTGWLKCDGASYSKTGAYANLYAVIGVAFGGTASNFNVPDMQLKYPKGADNAGVSPIGTTGGSTSYTPAGTVANHATANSNFLAGGSPYVTSNTHLFSGTPATIEPPFLVVKFIIKY